jgi:hypothetical protein
MAKLRNKTTDTLETRVAGRTYVTGPDDALEIPDQVYLEHLWPESIWDEIEVPPRPEPPEDPSAGTIADVIKRVDGDKELAHAALEAEQAKNHPRSSLVGHLNQIIQEG